MKTWAFLAGAVAAVGITAAAVVVLRQTRSSESPDEVPRLISDCFDRIHRIEADLQRLKSATDPIG